MTDKTAKVRLPFHFAKQKGVIVTEQDGQLLIQYLPNTNPGIILELQRVHDEIPHRLQAVTPEEFEQLLASVYDVGTESALAAISGLEENMDLAELIKLMPKTEDLLESEDDAPVIRLLNAIITQAIKQSASDIHFETFENRLVVRFRIDGVLREVLEPPRVLAPLLISRLKIMAKLDIAEKRLPQDGRIALRIAGRAIDVRVSTIPTQYGERIVLRLLDKQTAPLDLTKLGMSSQSLQTMQKLIQMSHGIILVTGPTGSGKTTTLYAALTQLNDATRNILTVEDPIEYYLPGIGQTQVNTKVDMTFARGLRAILRQDPDIVMVGEIRDLETAQMAVQASLTGHLVLSTLHTNSAIGAITRLRDMGVESFLIASTLIGVAAQRLVRVLCTHCKVAHEVTTEERRLLNITHDEKIEIYDAQGCEACANTGYTGRMGIYEIIALDEHLQNMIHQGQNELEMLRYARQISPSIRQDGWQKVLAGKTTIAEVMRVTSEI